MVTRRAEVLQALMTIGAHHVIGLDGITARCALAVFHELSLLERHLELLFVAVDLQQGRTQQAIRDNTQQRHERHDSPDVPQRTAHVRVACNPDDAEHVENDEANNDDGERSLEFRGPELG